MKKKRVRAWMLCTSLLVLGVAMLIASMAATSDQIYIPKPNVAFGQIEIRTWQNLTASKVFETYGKTDDGESSLRDVYQSQGKEYFTLSYGRTAFTFFNAREINRIVTTDPTFVGPRDTHVGMNERELFALFPCVDQTLLRRLRTGSEYLFESADFGGESTSRTLFLYDLGNTNKPPRYFGTVVPDPDGDANHYTVRFTHDVKRGGLLRQKRVYCLVEYEVANHAVQEMRICIIDVA